ncbi:ribosomal-protein-alanine N-acetyltransferase RimI, partial [Nitrospinae bacterium AH_259_B05_G02_I21]|nr:ribosomal-protein-alanine N-acetyltransferase RimI [Nitrospinae bacterium AH_259_B05_G02_I21]
DVARALGCTTASLEVRLSNEAAQQLYASYGFVVAGRRARYYQDGEDALIMTLERL